MSELSRRKSQNEKVLFENRLYSKKEVSKILQISIKTIDVWMKAKQIEFIKLGSAVRFRPNYLNNKFGG